MNYVEKSGGLSSERDYPYESNNYDGSGGEGRGICHESDDTHPNIISVREPRRIATVSKFGVLPPQDEDNMEKALRFVGPIAVGVHGTDPTFTRYEGGIYNNYNCPTTIDHAMVIVGYGEEKTGGYTQKYWIVRNSWGESWGEGGYIRIERGKGGVGICGINLGVSMAVEGTWLPSSKRGDVVGQVGGAGAGAGAGAPLDDDLLKKCDSYGITSRKLCLTFGGPEGELLSLAFLLALLGCLCYVGGGGSEPGRGKAELEPFGGLEAGGDAEEVGEHSKLIVPPSPAFNVNPRSQQRARNAKESGKSASNYSNSPRVFGSGFGIFNVFSRSPGRTPPSRTGSPRRLREGESSFSPGRSYGATGSAGSTGTGSLRAFMSRSISSDNLQGSGKKPPLPPKNRDKGGGGGDQNNSSNSTRGRTASSSIPITFNFGGGVGLGGRPISNNMTTNYTN